MAHQGNIVFLVISFVLVTCFLDNVLLLQGELTVRCESSANAACSLQVV